MLHTELAGQVFTQRLDTQTLCGMMPGGDEHHAAFLREMVILLGNFAGEIGIHTLGDGRCKVILPSAAAPRDFFYGLGAIPEGLRGAMQTMFDLLRKLVKCL